jgi:signal transduction histidine kinase
MIVQVLLLAFNSFLFCYLFLKGETLAIPLALFVLWLFQIGYLIYDLNKTNRNLSHFLNTLECQDASLVLSESGKDSRYSFLQQSFNRILRERAKLKIEKEQDFIFFQKASNLVGVSLLAFDHKGNVRFCNEAFRVLFLLRDFQNISELNKIDKDFPDFLFRVKTGKQKLRKYLVKHRMLKVAITAVDFRMDEDCIKLVAFQDVKNAMDRVEMETMDKLLHVFNEKVMNSLSPISQISLRLIDLYEKNGHNPCQEILSEGVISNTLMGLKTISKRSNALVAMFDEYKNFKQQLKPHFELILVEKLFLGIKDLLKDDFKAEHIEFSYYLQEEGQELIGDKNLLLQLFVHLIRNSIEALRNTESKSISISTGPGNPLYLIIVRDNGAGIENENIDHVFTPFFTSKEKRLGLGLNFARQIMSLHGGSISVRSKPERLTEFSLQF